MPRGAKKPAVEKAPGRGKYDRNRTPNEREMAQLERLIEAAGYVFAELGWADATVEAIVSRAGMSRRTFYEHFEDLRSCLGSVYENATHRAFQAVDVVVRAQVEPPDQLRLGVTAFLGSIAAFPHLARVVFRVARAAGPELETVHEEMLHRFAALFFDGLAVAHTAGLTELPPDELRVFALVSAMEAVAMRFVLRGEEAKALDAAPALIDMVQRTFGAGAR